MSDNAEMLRNQFSVSIPTNKFGGFWRVRKFQLGKVGLRNHYPVKPEGLSVYMLLMTNLS